MKHLALLSLLAALALLLVGCGKSDLLRPDAHPESGSDVDTDIDGDTDADSDTDTGTGDEVVCGWSEVDVGADDSELEVEWVGVWGTSAEDVWVTGYRHQSYFYYEPTVAHFDGTTWTVTHVDVAPGHGGWSVWASSPSDVYSSTCVVGIETEGFLVHFDGSTWTQVDLGVTFCGCIRSIWGRSSDDVYVAGNVELEADENRYLVHFDGSEWQVVEEFDFGALRDLWGVGESDLFAVGYDGRAAHFDGESWSLMETPTDEDLHTVWASSPTDVFAAAFFVDSSLDTPMEPLIPHYDGDEWSQMETDASLRSAHGLWGSASDNVYVIGKWKDTDESYWHKILRYDGADWTESLSQGCTHPANSLYDIWGSSATDIYAVGTGNLVLHYSCE